MTSTIIYLTLALAAALAISLFAIQLLRRRLHTARTEASDVRRRMRRVTVAAMVTQGVTETQVKNLIERDRPITIEEVAQLLEPNS
jgi:hypothetical protein